MNPIRNLLIRRRERDTGMAAALAAARTPTRDAQGNVVSLPAPVDELLTGADVQWDFLSDSDTKELRAGLWQRNLDACLDEAARAHEILRANRTQLPAPITRETRV